MGRPVTRWQIVAKDPERTADFYTRLFEWKIDADNPLNRLLYVDTKLWLPDFLLMRGDKMSMANSLEARVPLLDHKLVEFAATLPPKLKLKGMVQKYLLKEVGSRGAFAVTDLRAAHATATDDLVKDLLAETITKIENR